MTTAAELRHRVAFDKRQDITDEYGNWQYNFVEQFVIAAKIQARFGGEIILAERLTGRQPVTIVVRQSDQTRTIAVDWRVRDVRYGVEYAIRSIVDPDDKRQWLEILTETGVAQ